MFKALSSIAKAGIVGLSLALGVTGLASAGPVIPTAPSNSIQSNVLNVGNANEIIAPGTYGRPPIRRFGGRGNYQGDRGWRNGGNRSYYGRGWNRGDYGRDYRRGYRNYGGAGIVFGLGIPAYSYYGPSYYAPRYYAPRRVYRSGAVASSRVQWCYDRYRSYRASDNTYQPNDGPRRQCRAPF